MHTPDPLLLRTNRVLLAAVYLAGVAALFVPYSYDISVAKFTWYERDMVSDFFTSPRSWEDTSMILAALFAPGPFYVPLLLWLVQIRSLFDAALRPWELRLIAAATLGVAASAVCLLLVYTVLAVQNIDEWTSGNNLWQSVACLAAGWTSLPLIATVAWLHRIRPTTPGLLWLRLLRAAYFMQAAQVGACFGMEGTLQVGGWIHIGLAVWFVAEIIIFCLYGRRHSNGTAAHPLLRYWLPRGDADPRPEVPVCFKCGYDLRGTIPAGGRVCPECGTAIAAT